MRNKLLALALLALAVPAHADTIWSNLWRNADPRGKSYAEFKAGNYAAAAQDLAAFNDSDANYNRGNALAYAGNLQDALNAYDAALKRDPNNRDALHNRALVANALKQQPKQAPKQDQKQDGKNSPQNGQQSKNTQPGNQQNNGQSGKPSEKPDGKSSAKPDASNALNAQNAPNAAGAGASQRPPSAPAQPSAGAPAQTGQTGGRSDADQAKRDVAAGMKNGTPLSPSGTDGYGMRQPPTPTPQSEKQIAQDQWLRSIPDDPGGLLRRKFLIEHMLRQQSTQP